MTMSFSHKGKGHRILAYLTRGPSTLAEMRTAVAPTTATQARKIWHVITAMMEAGLLAKVGGCYEITPAGEDALACLDGGSHWAAALPNARVFANGRAA